MLEGWLGTIAHSTSFHCFKTRHHHTHFHFLWRPTGRMPLLSSKDWKGATWFAPQRLFPSKRGLLHLLFPATIAKRCLFFSVILKNIYISISCIFSSRPAGNLGWTPTLGVSGDAAGGGLAMACALRARMQAAAGQQAPDIRVQAHPGSPWEPQRATAQHAMHGYHGEWMRMVQDVPGMFKADTRFADQSPAL